MDDPAILEQHLDDLYEDRRRAQHRLDELERTPPYRIVNEPEVGQAIHRLRTRIQVLTRELAEGLRRLEALEDAA